MEDVAIPLKGLTLRVQDTGRTIFASYPISEFTTTESPTIGVVVLRIVIEHILRDMDAEDNLPMWSMVFVTSYAKKILQLQVIPASAPHNEETTFPLWYKAHGSESKLITLIMP